MTSHYSSSSYQQPSYETEKTYDEEQLKPVCLRCDGGAGTSYVLGVKIRSWFGTTKGT